MKVVNLSSLLQRQYVTISLHSAAGSLEMGKIMVNSNSPTAHNVTHCPLVKKIT